MYQLHDKYTFEDFLEDHKNDILIFYMNGESFFHMQDPKFPEYKYIRCATLSKDF